VDSLEVAGGFGGSAISSSTELVTFTDCYAWGDITIQEGETTVGGFLGSAQNSYTTFTNCYSIGSVSDEGNSGGFGGLFNANCTATSVYWDTEASGISTTSNDKGEGHTTTWLKTNPNYPDGWDFDTIWYQEYTPDSEVEYDLTGEPFRLLSYTYKTEESYVVEAGKYFMRFYKEAD